MLGEGGQESKQWMRSVGEAEGEIREGLAAAVVALTWQRDDGAWFR